MRVTLGATTDVAVIGACVAAMALGAARLTQIVFPDKTKSVASRPTVEHLDVQVPITDLQVEGKASAKVAIVEFSDFQCPYCAKYATETYQSVKREFVDTGRIEYAFVNYPLEIHPLALKASEAALCAADQGRFWEMHDRLFAKQPTLSDIEINSEAGAIGLAMDLFQSCLSVDRKTRVEKDKALGTHVGVTGTPTFLVGPLDGNNVHGTILIHGSQPIETFRKVLGVALSDAHRSARSSN
jgi:protein-disulfide isomerase